ncbi:hypothetical protein B0H14DRAFT_2659411 [Mycena olivaceomarginata]|nr:hypothetical protein B0H14DRAFT_2659411 [Mycena olivaceomarginata]
MHSYAWSGELYLVEGPEPWSCLAKLKGGLDIERSPIGAAREKLERRNCKEDPALRVHSSTKSRTRLDQSKNFSANLKAIELQDVAMVEAIDDCASGRKRGRRKERGQAVSDISIGVASVQFWFCHTDLGILARLLEMRAASRFGSVPNGERNASTAANMACQQNARESYAVRFKSRTAVRLRSPAPSDQLPIPTHRPRLVLKPPPLPPPLPLPPAHRAAAPPRLLGLWTSRPGDNDAIAGLGSVGTALPRTAVKRAGGPHWSPAATNPIPSTINGSLPVL